MIIITVLAGRNESRWTSLRRWTGEAGRIPALRARKRMVSRDRPAVSLGPGASRLQLPRAAAAVIWRQEIQIYGSMRGLGRIDRLRLRGQNAPSAKGR